MLYDAHIHYKNHENGGFLIGLEGEPKFEGALTNQEALTQHDPDHFYIAFYYVSDGEIEKTIGHPYLKYHPRREHYSSESVIKSIRFNNPKAVIIDTLNEPYWRTYDYWKVAKAVSDIPCIMAHSGGYLINDFIKICHFQPNVWIDFALTHTILGKLGDEKSGLPYVNQAIKYALNSIFKKRVLMSSDFPFFNQDNVFDYYKSYHDMLNKNFLNLLEVIK